MDSKLPVHPSLRAVLADEGRFQDYYGLRCDPNNAYWTGHATSPDKQRLQDWYIANLKSQSRLILLLYLESSIVGYLYIDLLAPGCYEISYGVVKERLLEGIGTAIVRLSEEYIREHLCQNSYVNAWIADNNIASIRCVEKNGFRPTDQTRSQSLAGTETAFRLYQKAIRCQPTFMSRTR